MMKAILQDITTLRVDAIVNAANSSLLGGGGVDGAIHRAAGPGLLDECRELAGCQVGQAKITAGYNLPAHFVIHTVGPVWKGGSCNEAQLLANCYTNSLSLATLRDCRSIAFPAISTGVYGYPAAEAARVAVTACRAYILEHEDPAELLPEITFCCFSTRDLEIYQALLSNL